MQWLMQPFQVTSAVISSCAKMNIGVVIGTALKPPVNTLYQNNYFHMQIPFPIIIVDQIPIHFKRADLAINIINIYGYNKIGIRSCARFS